VERFPEKRKEWDPSKREGIKSILKGNITINISDPHKLSPDLITCNGFGKIRKIKGFMTNDTDHYYNYIDHYYTKSTEEFVKKLMKGSIAHGSNTKFKMKRINLYFMLNDITLDKINYIENKTKFNLNKFRQIIVNRKNKTFHNSNNKN
jgi:hypothetical protein